MESWKKRKDMGGLVVLPRVALLGRCEVFCSWWMDGWIDGWVEGGGRGGGGGVMKLGGGIGMII